MGRRVEQLPENYNRESFLAWNDRSRANLGVETIDLVQLHCPPSEVYEDDAVFEALDEMVAAGRMAAYGVSVETCAQALAAIARPHVATVQIILNCFRLKPLEEVLPAAREAGVGIIARVPLASGLLSGRYDENTVFAPDDHRNLQSSRGGLRRRRDVRRRAVRGRPGRRARALGPGSAGCDDVAVRASLGDRPAGSQRRDPGRAQPRSGRGRTPPAPTSSR